MKYSIIIPVYNVENYIDDCMVSILNQDYLDYEIIIVDDGSQDSSGEKVDFYAENYDKVRVFHQDNSGVVSARRYGLKESKGEYVIFIDSDDYIEDGYLSYIDNIIKKNNPDVVVTGFSLVNQKGIFEGRKILNKTLEGSYDRREIDRILNGFIYDSNDLGINYGSLHYSLWCKIVKRQLYLKYLTDTADILKYGEDMVLSYYILNDKDCKSMTVTNYAGYYYRDNGNSVTNSISLRSISDYNKTVECLYILLGESDNRISVYAFRALYGALSEYAMKVNSLIKFKKAIKSTYENDLIWEYAKKTYISSPSIKEKLKLFMLSHSCYILIYMINKWK
ncbi:glycosyltransferase family 2 protein [uncultured Eubacterium sp.]|uniref:glycosyltransferase family 2 protein n=1 Tax=uncultured Eubacterium sp. TaxID=165185 RepID=UPI0025922B26|nr:glycosyltransferase family 2 protein [uncultured Eubacterium sp.]